MSLFYHTFIYLNLELYSIIYLCLFVFPKNQKNFFLIIDILYFTDFFRRDDLNFILILFIMKGQEIKVNLCMFNEVGTYISLTGDMLTIPIFIGLQNW